MEAGAGPLHFAHFNDLARGGTIARSVAFRNIPGPSVPQIVEEVHPTGTSLGRVFCARFPWRRGSPSAVFFMPAGDRT